MSAKNDHPEHHWLLMQESRRWWGNRFAESVFVWNQAMTHPVSRILPSNGMIQQVTFLLVFALLPLFRHIAQYPK
jgi:hypothetical protein